MALSGNTIKRGNDDMSDDRGYSADMMARRAMEFYSTHIHMHVHPHSQKYSFSLSLMLFGKISTLYERRQS